MFALKDPVCDAANNFYVCKDAAACLTTDPATENQSAWILTRVTGSASANHPTKAFTVWGQGVNYLADDVVLHNRVLWTCAGDFVTILSCSFVPPGGESTNPWTIDITSLPGDEVPFNPLPTRVDCIPAKVSNLLNEYYQYKDGDKACIKRRVFTCTAIECSGLPFDAGTASQWTLSRDYTQLEVIPTKPDVLDCIAYANFGSSVAFMNKGQIYCDASSNTAWEISSRESLTL